MKAFDTIHGIVHSVCKQATSLREKTEVRVLADDGVTYEISEVKLDQAHNIVWIKVTEAND
jgi:hypothetical protein